MSTRNGRAFRQQSGSLVYRQHTCLPRYGSPFNGFVKGKVELTPNGLLIGEAGDYSVTFSAILENPVEAYTALIPVFLSLNGQFNPLDPIQSSLGGVVTLPTGFINTVQGTGILHDVPAGTFLALIASNGGSPDPQPIRVVAWNISLFKIACDSPRCRPCPH